VAESIKHIELVACIVRYVRAHYKGIQSVAIRHDMPGYIGCDKPPLIGDYRPDLFAIDAPLTTTIIGEAKTAGDLETNHTHMQLAHFIRFLCLQTNPVLILGVPWQARARGLGLVNSIIDNRGIEPSLISVVIVDDVQVN
jgi:hypothetical protein